MFDQTHFLTKPPCKPFFILVGLLLLLRNCWTAVVVSGAWVYEDVNSDDYDTDSGYTPAPPGPLNPASGLLSGLNRVLGRAGPQQGGAGDTADSGEVYFPPQQELPLVAGTAAGQQQQQQGGSSGSRRSAAAAATAPGGIPTTGVLPGVTKSGPGLLHGDKISLQSLLQVCLLFLSVGGC